MPNFVVPFEQWILLLLNLVDYSQTPHLSLQQFMIPNLMVYREYITAEVGVLTKMSGYALY